MALLAAYYAPATTSASLDQYFTPSTVSGALNVGDSNQVDWAQTFTVGMTGTLSGFDIWIERHPTVQLPLLFDIRTTSGGLPTLSDVGPHILIAGEKAASDIPVDRHDLSLPLELVHFDLSSASIAVTVGDVLAIVLRSDDPSGQPDGLTYSWFAASAGGVNPFYPGGESYAFSGGWFDLPAAGDAVFRTYVTPIPEPTACCLLGLGCVMFGMARSRRFHPARRQRM
ncbi:hypothetical protein [Lacipirellula sp.]|uniref:hypothetical protein n=1 Tax=Lacipirellula sp. TaxID=2691419 RepID=UPI003D0BAB26